MVGAVLATGGPDSEMTTYFAGRLDEEYEERGTPEADGARAASARFDNGGPLD